MEQFIFTRVDDKELLEEVYRLRYKVYCEERGFEDAEDHPEGIERDIYDQHSVHFAALRRSDRFLIGTMRLILDSEHGFPIERHSSIDSDLSHLRRGYLAEISRFAVSKEIRRDACCPGPLYVDCYMPLPAHQVLENRCDNQEFCVILGLYAVMYRESIRLGLTHWYGLMARSLHVLLRRKKIPFHPVGPEIDYHGVRRPYLASIQEVRDTFFIDKMYLLNGPELVA